MNQERDDLVTVLEVEGTMEAEIVKTKLESAGISCLLKFESSGRLFGIITDGLGKVQVQVSAQDEADAKKILSDEE